MSYNLFLDDERQPKCLGDTRTWEVVRNYSDFKTMILNRGVPSFISFDHDLAGQQYAATIDDHTDIIYADPLWKDKTGYHCAHWLAEYCRGRGIPLPQYQVHSMNPVGRVNIKQLLESYKEREHLWIRSKPEASEKP
jgi:hypothetical protein